MRYRYFTLVIVSLITMGSFAQIVNIPDTNFKDALLNYFIPIDTNEDGEIQVAEAEAVIELLIPEQGISDLTGIEAFINLTELNVGGNLLTTIDISPLQELLQFYAWSNMLPTMDLSANLGLTEIVINNNLLTEIDVSQHLELEMLVAGSQDITELDVTNNTVLRVLNMNSASLTALDVTQNLQLEELVVSNNEMSTIDVTQNTRLKELAVSNNLITTVDLSQNAMLEDLFFNRAAVSSLDVTNNPALTGLYIWQTDIAEIDLRQNTNLEWLIARDTPMQTLNLINNVNLFNMDISRTDMTFINLSNQSNLAILRADGIVMEQLDLSSNTSLCNLNVTNSTVLKSINLQNGANTNFDPSGSCGNNGGVPIISLAGNTSLEFVCVDDVTFAETFFTDLPAQASFTENCSLGTVEVTASDMRVYPNPASDYITIDGIESLSEIRIYGLSGALVSIQELMADKPVVDLQHLQAGMYFLQLKSQAGTQIIQLIKK